MKLEDTTVRREAPPEQLKAKKAWKEFWKKEVLNINCGLKPMT